jgi:magnesium transporter
MNSEFDLSFLDDFRSHLEGMANATDAFKASLHAHFSAGPRTDTGVVAPLSGSLCSSKRKKPLLSVETGRPQLYDAPVVSPPINVAAVNSNKLSPAVLKELDMLGPLEATPVLKRSTVSDEVAVPMLPGETPSHKDWRTKYGTFDPRASFTNLSTRSHSSAFQDDSLVGSPRVPVHTILETMAKESEEVAALYHDHQMHVMLGTSSTSFDRPPALHSEANPDPSPSLESPLRKRTLHVYNAAMCAMEYVSVQGFTWVDVIGNPDRNTEDFQAYLEQMATENDIHEATIKDCLTPFHLPRVEKIGNWTVLILRYTRNEALTDPNIEPTMPALTHKLVLLVSSDKLITIRRGEAMDDFPEVMELVRTWNDSISLDHLVNKFLDDVVTSFHDFLLDDSQELEEREDEVDKNVTQPSNRPNSDVVWRLYKMQRRVTVHRRLIALTNTVIVKYTKLSSSPDPFQQDVKDSLQSALYHVENLYENINNLLRLHLALVDNRTNQFLYVLTTFSIVFIPLTFIAGFYGMNFELLEFSWSFGAHYAYGLTLSTFIVTFLWLRLKNYA